MNVELSQWVHAVRGRRVLLIGDLILDRYVYGDAERISPEAPVPVLRTVGRKEAVGGSANVAACLKALGCEVVCCGVIGRDRDGETLTRLLADIGVDAAGVITLAERPTTAKTRLVGLAQHRHRQQLLRVDEEDSSPLASASHAELERLVRHLMPTADVICVEDYGKGVVSEPLLQGIVAEAGKRERPVLVDPARLNDYARYRGADVITPNRDELSLVAGRRLESLESAAEAARNLIEACGFGAVVVTVDRDGAVLVEKGRPWRHLATTPRSVYDNTGAGDAVLAMLTAAIAAGADLDSAARLANVAGGLEVEKFGCVPITAEEVLAELRLEDRRRNGKLRSVDELAAELQLRRDRGETVAFTNGCFDLLHAGHVDFLARCRREASILIVGLNGDDSVRALNKGADRPINRFEHRASVLSSLECVDYVVGFDEPNPETLIRKLRPDVLIKGRDWEGQTIAGHEFVESSGGRVLLLPLIEGISTTALIDRIRGGSDRSHATRAQQAV